MWMCVCVRDVLYLLCRFLGTGIQYCFTRNLSGYSPHFYFCYFLRAVTGAVACAFLCVSVDRVGRRGILLITAIVTGLSSLLLLALTQCINNQHHRHHHVHITHIVTHYTAKVHIQSWNLYCVTSSLQYVGFLQPPKITCQLLNTVDWCS